MTKTERIAELEKAVQELQARPAPLVVPYPVYQPLYQFPYWGRYVDQPWYVGDVFPMWPVWTTGTIGQSGTYSGTNSSQE